MNELLKELKRDLEGKKLTLLEFDNYMMVQNFYSVFNDGVEESIINDENVVYTQINDTSKKSKEVIIYFNILKLTIATDLLIEIISVEEF